MYVGKIKKKKPLFTRIFINRGNHHLIFIDTIEGIDAVLTLFLGMLETRPKLCMWVDLHKLETF